MAGDHHKKTYRRLDHIAVVLPRDNIFNMPFNAVEKDESSSMAKDGTFFREITALDKSSTEYFSSALVTDSALTRKLVSFQANKGRAYYRWYKHKEAFSAELVEYLLHNYRVNQGRVLDPFAGTGTSLFVSSSLGYDADGIEVLPVGQRIINANILARGATKQNIIAGLDNWLLEKPWNTQGPMKDFAVLRITKGAYSSETQGKIGRYLHELEHESIDTKELLLFALLCILESISYTRKDGQYLRWDYRSGRRNGKTPFDKGAILPFDEAIIEKLHEIKQDINRCDDKNDLFTFLHREVRAGDIRLFKGSCLDILPQLERDAYSGIITSPPYCNRYDYTRTYALEHAILGINEAELMGLRQALLSCTVENRAKKLTDFNNEWKKAIDICDGLPLLQKILNYLDYKKEQKELNNSGIARMVRGYFYEMSCVIQECYRVLDKGGLMFMVNDNVRYAGAAISVDTLLSKIAETTGFRVENILVLPQGKGNSSQQMGKHGRTALRKCVCVWKKRA